MTNKMQLINSVSKTQPPLVNESANVGKWCVYYVCHKMQVSVKRYLNIHPRAAEDLQFAE